MDPDFALLAAEATFQLVLLALLLHKRLARTLPIFVAYNVYGLVFDLIDMAVMRKAPDARLPQWIAGMIVETVFFLLVVVELGKNVVRFNRNLPTSRVLAAAFFAVSTLILLGIVRWGGPPANYPLLWRIGLRLNHITTVLQVASVCTLAAWSGLLRMRWPDRELHLVTGMGIWTVVSLAVLMIHNNGVYDTYHYRWIDLVTTVTCVGVLAWWIHCFWFEPTRTERIQILGDFGLASRGTEN
jgi:hypothetical protein